MSMILCRSCNQLKHDGQDWHCGQCVSEYVREQTLIRHNQARRIAVLEQGNRSFKAEEEDWHEMNARRRAVNAQLAEACEKALAYLSDADARDDMSDRGFMRYDDVCDALRDALAAAKEAQ